MPPQKAFLTSQTHASVQNFRNPSINASQVINAAGKEFIRKSPTFLSCLVLPSTCASSPPQRTVSAKPNSLFTPPPTNMSTFLQWTTTSPY
ncbi:hypothetical protein FRC00_003794 [Tulasnella sp. 408]|nr:hypothetical protein FRC00_003794 [Tulasnella sp. 408]